MKRLTLTAGLALAVALPATAEAKLSHTEAVSYGRAYAHVKHVMGARAAGCKLIGPRTTCHRSSDRMVRRSTDTLQRMFAPPPPPPAPVHYTPAATASSASSYYHASSSSYQASSSGGGYSSIPGVPSSYAACVAYHESTNGTNPAAHGNVYGIIPASGTNAGSGSIAEQKAAFSELYAKYGTKPWQGDGC